MSGSTTITEKTRVPISLVLLIVSASACGVGLFAAIKQDVSDLKRISGEKISREEFKDWAHELDRRNNYIDVPSLPPKAAATVPHPSRPFMGLHQPAKP